MEKLKHFIPELLAPAGNLEKLKVAISYGADAVYLGGQKFGLRQAADNFTQEELIEGVEYAHSKNAKVFVVLNSFLHDKDLDELPEFLRFLEEIKVDAVIVSDLGVVKTVKKLTNLVVHLSTQASCLNSYAAKLWKKMGVDRVIVGRELTVKEAAHIKKESGLEVEMFIHGSMCMAYSGNCVISNYTQGRDSNRGGCAHSCRFEYSFDLNNEENKKSYFMSSKDLEGIRVLQDFIDAGIDSIKIEGRMKSNLYAGTVSKVYRDALNYYQEHGHFLSNEMIEWEKELNKMSHRAYSLGSLVEKAGKDSIFDERENVSLDWVVAGNVVAVIEGEALIVEVKNAFHPHDKLELLPFRGKPIEFTPNKIESFQQITLERTKPSTLVKIPYIPGAMKWNILRKQI